MTSSAPTAARRARLCLALATGCLVLALAGCTQAPFDVDGAVQTEATVNRLPATFPERSARVYPLTSGPETLATWLDLIGGSRERIDIMTFILRADQSGRVVAKALVEAADRGVRIRLLVDDAFMAMRDDRLGGLTRHPNIELRAFNPFSRAAPSVVGYVLDRARLNRRMHNKVLIVDGRTAILGGRNVGDEYFGQDRAKAFADFDLLVRGDVVPDLTEGFDVFWNDFRAVAYDRLWPRPAPNEIDALANATTPPPLLPDSAARLIATGRAHDFVARITHVIDDPEKLSAAPSGNQRPQHVARLLGEEIGAARHDVLIVTPYFVPQREGVDFLASLVKRGVAVRVVTNSLAATNHRIAHGSYARYRNELAALGVVFFETRPEAGPWMDKDGASAKKHTTMHAKLAIIDSRIVLAGSPNFDPRSLRLNSESLLRIDSPALATRLASDWASVAEHGAYRVSVDPNGLVRWTRPAEPRPTFLTNPGAGLLSRLIAIFGDVLPIEDDL